MIRKWYFCISEASLGRDRHDWEQLIFSAVDSALAHTALKPILVYDGEPNALTAALSEKGVQIVHHRVSFYDELVRRDAVTPGYLSIASGAFLRVEIPRIEKEDEFVLYTDCDVHFLRDPKLDRFRPAYFACSTQTTKTDFVNDMNTGVMVMNVPQLRRDLPEFTRFIIDNLDAGWPGCDQENYRRYYRGKWNKLPVEFNWKPYWGENNRTAILHWHGPKPVAIRQKLLDPNMTLPPDWESLFARDPRAYKSFLTRIGMDLEGGAPAPPPTRKLVGHIDRLSAKAMHGWVLDMGQPTVPASIRVVVNGDLEIVVQGSEYRSDLKRLYKTDVGGFAVQFPNDMSIGEEPEFRFTSFAGEPVALGFRGKQHTSLTVDLNAATTAENEPSRSSGSGAGPAASARERSPLSSLPMRVARKLKALLSPPPEGKASTPAAPTAPPPELTPIDGAIDQVALYGSVVNVTGWALTDTKERVPALALRLGDYLLNTGTILRTNRPDVVRVYPGAAPDAGFRISFPLTGLPPAALVPGKLTILAGQNARRLDQYVKVEGEWNPAELNPVPRRPLMPPAAVEALTSAMRKSRCYLEYGTGGSTRLAFDMGIPDVVAVESDPQWLGKVHLAIPGESETTRQHLLYADIGPTGPLGYPTSDQAIRRYHEYPFMPWDECERLGITPDLVLIDGRFRLACMLATLLCARPGCVVLFDDYFDRPYYQSVETFVERGPAHDRMCEFNVPATLDRDGIWKAFLATMNDAR